ncbi:HAD-IA family hydrolase [Microbacterium marinilacus]|uniref:HAD family hydrolase n=1 Tax=Microbacterium marinilacus TaxID=415209 RepID=A0ABP7B7E6_9MICO|nr:HAD-IA family hydrolase [Microbacterium marinilacus]MBY0687388.1 HAD-IA family hydrolase [Microbacterium marinilacus]
MLPIALRTAPRALLLDFGGVLFQTAKRPEGRDELAASLADRLARAGSPVPAAVLRGSLDAGLAALKHWKHASSRRLEPREMGHREVVGDFLAADLPPAARAVLVAEAPEVLAELNVTLSVHTVRPGIRALLAEAQRRGIPLGIVSNAHSGRSHRQLLEAHGLADAFAAQVYSDEVGMRKPHPGMIDLACAALGVAPQEAWYVGDTQDRDVVAGRRAGVGAVVLTTSQHTDSPPFAVVDEADAVFATPAGLHEALAASTPGPLTEPAPAPAPRRGALLIDHGGVISTSERDEESLAEFGAHLSRLLDGEDAAVTPADALALVHAGRARHKDLKRHARSELDAGGANREITPVELWRDLVGAGLTPRQRAVLEAEAHDLTYRLGRAKSRRTLRPGVRELLEHCRDAGLPVVVVSNTISGRAVRDECAEHGLDRLIGAYVCSDENGHRKPDPRIVAEALRIADADPARVWFYGDKPANDAAAARAFGIAHRVIVRGGSTDDASVDASVQAGQTTHAVDGASDLLRLMRADSGARAAVPA